MIKLCLISFMMWYSFASFSFHTFESKYDFLVSEKKIEAFISKKGLRLFKAIDHTQNAEEAKLKLLPNKVYILGNPNVGTPLMQNSPTAGIDLPIKVHVHSDDKNRTFISYNTPKYLSEKHGISAHHPSLIKMKKVLGSLESLLK